MSLSFSNFEKLLIHLRPLAADAGQTQEDKIDQQISELVAALQNAEHMSTAAIHSTLVKANEIMVEWQKEWAEIHRRASCGSGPIESAKLQGPWETREERQERWDNFVADEMEKARKTAKGAKFAGRNRPEGVVTVPAARSPGQQTTERAPAKAKSAPAKKPARRLPIPKELAIDMVNDLAPTEATGRGQRVRKPRAVFGEVAAPSQGKRKRAAVEDAPTATAAPPSKKRATTREASVVSVAAAATPAAANNKRKRATEDVEVAAAAPPPTKKRATSRAASTAPLRMTTRATSRAGSAAPSRAASAAPHNKTRATSRAASATPSATPPPDFTAPVPKRRGRARKDQSAAVAAKEAEHETEAVKEEKGKGRGIALAPVQEGEAEGTTIKGFWDNYDDLYDASDRE